MNPDSQQIKLAALLGFLAVGLGAFGAHGLAEILKSHDTVEIWKTASHYHMIHAVALLLLATIGGTEDRLGADVIVIDLNDGLPAQSGRVAHDVHTR